MFVASKEPDLEPSGRQDGLNVHLPTRQWLLAHNKDGTSVPIQPASLRGSAKKNFRVSLNLNVQSTRRVEAVPTNTGVSTKNRRKHGNTLVNKR